MVCSLLRFGDFKSGISMVRLDSLDDSHYLLLSLPASRFLWIVPPFFFPLFLFIFSYVFFIMLLCDATLFLPISLTICIFFSYFFYVFIYFYCAYFWLSGDFFYIVKAVFKTFLSSLSILNTIYSFKKWGKWLQTFPMIFTEMRMTTFFN